MNKDSREIKIMKIVSTIFLVLFCLLMFFKFLFD